MTATERAGAILTIDLGAVVDNWRLIAQTAKGAEAGAVVKADGYGLGAARVGRALAKAGCTTFYVARIEEGVRLRAALPAVDIHVLDGLLPATQADLMEHRLIPVLNSRDQVHAWAVHARHLGRKLPADLHVDTGMNRLGLDAGEVDDLLADPSDLDALDLRHVASHLACSDERRHPMNAAQRERFAELRRRLPRGRGSLANSSGIFLGKPFHFDAVRPGAALYGVNPHPDEPNPMAQAVQLQGRILQVRFVDSPHSVGYGATHAVARRTKIATVAVGYADGYLRSLSNRGTAHIGEAEAPLVGRVSMDLITLDVTTVPERLARPGGLVDLIGPHHPLDAVAAAAGTIGYEILTSLGARYHRVYLGDEAGP